MKMFLKSKYYLREKNKIMRHQILKKQKMFNSNLNPNKKKNQQ